MHKLRDLFYCLSSLSQETLDDKALRIVNNVIINNNNTTPVKKCLNIREGVLQECGGKTFRNRDESHEFSGNMFEYIIIVLMML